MPTKYRLTERAYFRVLGGGQMEGELFGAVFKLPLDFYRVLIEFTNPSTVAEVYERFDTGMDIEAFEATLEMPISRGILVESLTDGTGASTASILDVAGVVLRAELKRPSGPFRDSLMSGSACFIKNAFDPLFAEDVARQLEDVSDWVQARNTQSWSTGFAHTLPMNRPWPGGVTRLRSALDHPESKKLITELTGEDCMGPAELVASAYLPGDHAMPHNDRNFARTVSMVWYLTREWVPEWGGNFFWCYTNQYILPQFNTLALFITSSQKSWHMVSPVTPEAQGRRLAVSAWFTAGREQTVPRAEADVSSDWSTRQGLMREVAPGIFATPG
jgi:hypothetical protein